MFKKQEKVPDHKIDQERFDAQKELLQLVYDQWADTHDLRAVMRRQFDAYGITDRSGERGCSFCGEPGHYYQTCPKRYGTADKEEV